MTIIVAVIALVLCLVAGALGLRAQRATSRLETNLHATMQTVQDQLANLQNQLRGLDIAMNIATQQPSRYVAGVGDMSASGDDFVASLVALEGSVSRLEQLVDEAGIEDVATNNAVSPTMLRDMVGEYAERRQVETLQQTLRSRNEELHAADKDRYGDAVVTLYEQSRMRFGQGGRGQDQSQQTPEQRREQWQQQQQQRDQAFQELVDRYPDSYAAGMLIAERALGASFRGSYDQVEQYYRQLDNNPNFNGIVTDWGMDAKSMLQYNLARYYASQNRTAEANAMLDALERTGNNGLVFNMGRRGPNLETAARAAANLRQQMQSGQVTAPQPPNRGRRGRGRGN